MNKYLDTTKSVMISSPAGSGKTEKLSRRYIALLQSGIDVERILAITFTDKAAAEMKQRIFRILKNEDEDLFLKLLDRMPLMRVSTIHSFCGTLLRRFSFEAEIDPNYRVEDALSSTMAWEAILYEVLMDAGKGSKGHDILLQSLSEKGFRGLDYLQSTVEYLFLKSPFSLEAELFQHRPCANSHIDELRSWHGVHDTIENYEDFFKEEFSEENVRFENYFLTSAKQPRKRPLPFMKGISNYRDWAFKMHLYWKDKMIEEHVKRSGRIRNIYRDCLAKYSDRKKIRGALDFTDLEYISYKLLTENPEWANILYAFDEKTDHILVDEFQDTNSFQWEIINKLTEEWRSGMGAKRDEGTQPTLFFVGDEKQSIYFFRGANVEIFHRAKEKLTRWLGDEFYYEEVKENYRSCPAIVEFTNQVFSKIMQRGENSPPWITRYSPFSAQRPGLKDTGRVELILLGSSRDTAQEKKKKEAVTLAQRIQGLAGNFLITDRTTQQQRQCRYMDMAVLLRKRTHLKIYEEALRARNIPFVAVKGIGYYQETEVALLRSLVFFLSNPRDDYSLYVLLKSPLFSIEESEIIQLTNSDGDCLFTKLKNSSENMKSAGSSFLLLQSWLSHLPSTSLSELIEQAITETKAWTFFHSPQRRANIKKFITIVEALEAGGKSILKIRDFLERTSTKNEEPKATVNTEGMDAVKILTIHAAKGLEFPLVFLPGLDDPFSFKTGENLIYEKEGRFYFKSEPELSIRKEDEDFMIHQEREEEEQKRLFYVAVTRAEDGLFLIGHWNGKDKSFLAFLRGSLGIEEEDGVYRAETEPPGFSILTEDDVKSLYRPSRREGTGKKKVIPLKATPLSSIGQTPWKTVTETADITSEQSKDRAILGEIMHKIFEALSKGTLKGTEIETTAGKLLESKGVQENQKEELLSIIRNDIDTLKGKTIWHDIILPQENAFTELPFIYEEGDAVYTGRIDRIIKEGNSYRVYDYKTFPAGDKEMGQLLKEYSFQLNVYKRAVMKLFNTTNVTSHVVFTHTGDVREA